MIIRGGQASTKTVETTLYEQGTVARRTLLIGLFMGKTVLFWPKNRIFPCILPAVLFIVALFPDFFHNPI